MAHIYFFLVFFTSLLSSSPSPSLASSLKSYNVVRDFGAKKNGKTDTTRAFLNAWNAACASLKPSQIYVPNGNYLLGHIQFDGTLCKNSILFKIDGTLVANNVENSEIWIGFHKVDGVHIKGGTLDAKGKHLWNCKLARRRCPLGAKTLNIDNSKNMIIDGLTSRDSQMFHISINACQNINMGGLQLTAAANSPNTDGIHIERSNGITIMHSRFMTGDDCISIGPRNQNFWIENVFCGPGHGISIGSLGRSQIDEGFLVKNVTVKGVTLTDTDNGLRIKTFASSIRGTVKDIYFIGATMNNVRNPIIIDQNYCPQGNCQSGGQGSRIQIMNVAYKNIKGVSSSPEVVTFNCSPQKPCHGLNLKDIKLSYTSKAGSPICQLKNARWTAQGLIQLPPKCLTK